MGVNSQAWHALQKELSESAVLVAVSKIRQPEEILALYNLGQRDFGENYVQELVDKQSKLPDDIRWHFIGHLQSNKVKQIISFAYLIQGVDSLKLLKEINKQAAKMGRTVNVLLQVHIAVEESKFGLDEGELTEIMQQKDALPGVKICGLMGMASNTDDTEKVRLEFRKLHEVFNGYQELPDFRILSMGMSGDYALALEEGSNMVRIGSLLFGRRN
ncbi:MAG: YggS family pyridoxal phosphate-dependent enzyme [Gemmatimonadaceae bacterium]|nr:YggS family pyridoxal phosphate-dependent enzyme [Chitinophagaceae bacterium]